MKYPSILSPLVIFLLFVTNGKSQCEGPLVQEFLHANEVRAGIMNRGDNFWNLDTARFQVPYGGPQTPSTIFAQNIWLSGTDDNGDIRFVSEDFRSRRECGCIPGPISSITGQVDPDQWDLIFNVNGEDILAHIEDFEDGVVDVERPSIYYWPGNGNPFFEQEYGFDLPDSPDGFAPFHETPGNVNAIYEPHLGEYPLPQNVDPSSIPGQIIYTVFNSKDIGDLFEAPLIEIHQTFYAWDCQKDNLDHTIFVDYKLINRDDQALDDFRFGLWYDPDLGCHLDDHMGTSIENETTYAYNSDNEDGPMCGEPNPSKGYGIDPPVQTVTVLGENAQLRGTILDRVMYLGNTDLDHERLIHNIWPDGTPLTHGDLGHNPGSTDSTNYIYSEPPSLAGGWSMHQVGPPPEDVRMLMIIQSADQDDTTLDPGESLDLSLAYSFFREDSLDHIEIVDLALENLPALRQRFNEGMLGCTTQLCSCNCVWPGDTDKNGEVNYLDAVNIFRSLGISGPIRNTSLAWKGNDATQWGTSVPMGVDHKYVDANGDGVIDTVDARLLHDYIGRTNTCHTPTSDICRTGPDLTWEHGTGDTIFGRRAIHVDYINLNIDTAFVGLSLELIYDPDLFLDIRVDDILNWTGISKNYSFEREHIDSIEGREQMVFFNDAGVDLPVSTSRDRILRVVNPQNPSPASYPAPYAEIRICNATMYFEDGSKMPLRTQTLRYPFADSVVITSTNEQVNRTDLEIYPNPAGNTVHISVEQDVNWPIALTDLRGTVVLRDRIDGSKRTLEGLDLKPGLYFLRFFTPKGMRTEKLVIK